MGAQTDQGQKKKKGSPGDIPPAEWAVAALGLLIFFFVVAFVFYEGVAGDTSAPDIAVRQKAIHSVEGGYVVEVEIENRGGTTASGVQIEGTVRPGSGPEETAQATIDHVAPHSVVNAGLFFKTEPRAGALSLRPLGYQEP